MHFNSKRVLFIDVDSAKVGGMGTIVYHVDSELPATKDSPNRLKVRPVLFLSRLLKSAETRYWPTELELAGIV